MQIQVGVREGGPGVITFIDKLIGVDVIVHRFDGETGPVGMVVPVDKVPELIRWLHQIVADGNVAIAREEMEEQRS